MVNVYDENGHNQGDDFNGKANHLAGQGDDIAMPPLLERRGIQFPDHRIVLVADDHEDVDVNECLEDDKDDGDESDEILHLETDHLVFDGCGEHSYTIDITHAKVVGGALSREVPCHL